METYELNGFFENLVELRRQLISNDVPANASLLAQVDKTLPEIINMINKQLKNPEE